MFSFRKFTTAYVLASLLFTAQVMAAETPSATSVDSVTVTLPESSIAGDSTQNKSPAGHSEIEFFASSWQPSHIATGSRVANASAFKTIGIPYLSVAYESQPLLERQFLNISLIAGLGFLAMNRTGTLAYETGSLADNQHLYLVPASVGFQLRPTFLSWRMLQTYGRLLLTPSLVAIEESTLGDQTLRVGLDLQAIAGMSFGLGWLWHEHSYDSGPKLHVGAVSTFGSLTSTDLSGFGIQSGIGFAF